MTDRALIGIGRTAAVVGAVFASAGALLVASEDAEVLLTEGGAFLSFATFFAVVVWLVIPRQPRNPVTWILVATALFAGVYIAAWTVAFVVTGDDAFLTGLYVPADQTGSAAWFLLAVIPISSGVIVTQMTFGILLFPDGKLPSSRWRWVGVYTAVAIGMAVLATAWMFRPWSTAPAQGGGPVDLIGTIAILIAALLALIALFRRFRRSSGTIRQQVKWVLWGASVLVLSLAVLTPFQGTDYQDPALAAFAVAGAIFVASYGIALGKYRLYDIDVVISRTVVYGTLAVFITGVYVATVVGIASLFGVDAESSPWIFVGATALIAFAFEPLRQRLQRWANRLVYGKRATPYEVLSDFSRNMTATDEELLNQVARSLAEGTTAAEAAVWMRKGDMLTRTSVWPESERRPTIEAPIEGAAVPEADMARAVIHDGEILGALSLTADRGQTLLPTDERLLEQVASGMGLALRNMGLSVDLRQHVEELRRSRGRLLTVQDETRRHLERELHDGAQQRLVALKLKLTLAKRQAADSGVEEVADLLDDVAMDTDKAIDSLRDFARGIYPPLLEAEGPAAALTSQVRKLPIQITIHAVGLSRHERPIEAAVYFCVLEALQNVVKHAGASSAHVAIHDSDGALSFEVADDGIGFETAAMTSGSGLANLADRLDALDGTLEVTSSPGMGTTIQGRIPSRQLEVAG